VRHVLRATALLGGLALVAVLLAACGGGNEGEPAEPTAPASPIATATPMSEEQIAAEALLKAIALHVEDLPEGFTLVDEGFTTNEDVAAEEGTSPGALTVEDLDGLGRILGSEIVYSRDATSGTLLLLLSTDVYRDSAGASEHFELLRDQPSGPELLQALQQQAPASGLEIQDATISPLSIAEVGDDRLAFEVKSTVHVPDLDTNVDQFARFVEIRRARCIGTILAIAVGSPIPMEELENLARTLDERMKGALE
jgi:hypothetical protein